MNFPQATERPLPPRIISGGHWPYHEAIMGTRYIYNATECAVAYVILYERVDAFGGRS